MTNPADPATVTFALIGAGIIGPRHAQSIQRNPSTTLIAIVEPHARGLELANQLSTPHFNTVADFLTYLADSKTKCDAAVVCTPNDTHVEIAIELLDAEIHVICEKPVATTIEDGRKLIAHHTHLCETKYPDLSLGVGHHRRFNTYVTAAKQAIDSGNLGTIIAVNGLWCSYKPDSYFEAPCDWRRGVDGGVILTNLVHDVDILQYLLGPIVRVHAEKTTPRRHTETTPHPADEGAAMTFRFQNGVVGTFLCSDVVPSPYNFEHGTGENPLMPKENGTDFYRIFGTQGTLSVPDSTRWSYDGQDERSWRLPLTKEILEIGDIGIPFDLQIAHFVDVVRGIQVPRCSAKEALSALIVCDAVRTSMKTGETVTIDADW